MKKIFLNLVLMFSIGFLITSCVSEEKDSVMKNGVGGLILNVTSDAGFQSRTVNECNF